MPANNDTFRNRLRRSFNALLLGAGIGLAAGGAVNAVDGFTTATMQDFNAASACDANANSHKPCTTEQVTSLRNIRTSFQDDAMGLTLLMGGGLLMLKGREGEEKLNRAKPGNTAKPA